MRRLLTLFLLLVFVTSIWSQMAMAKEVRVKPIRAEELTEMHLDGFEKQTCVVGNVNPPALAVPDFIKPPELYKLAFDPRPGCGASCNRGFEITAVHIILQTVEACELFMAVDLESAVFPGGPSCPVPGMEECLSDVYTVDLPGPGLYDIALPIECGCAYFDYIYMLGVSILSASCASGGVPDLIIDTVPTGCTSWNNFGQGWVDLVSGLGAPGNLNIWADVVCCDEPVGTDDESMGMLKGRYKD